MVLRKISTIIPRVTSVLLLGGVLLAPTITWAQSPFPVTPEMIDRLDTDSATWPADPAVPKLPPLSKTDDVPIPKDNFLYSHYWDGLHPPKNTPPARLTGQAMLAKPLKVDVIWSMRSPYSYLVLTRLVWLHSNYNVDLTVRPVMPIAVRSTKGGSGKAGGAFGIWYKLPDTMWDTVRSATYNGVPFKWPTPDPIWQNIHPVHGERWEYVHPPEKQPYIGWLVRLCAYAQMKGKGIDCVNQVSHLIFGNQEEHWPAHVKERFNKIESLDYDEAIKFIQDNPEKVDAVWTENSKVQAQAGHGGVPLFIFQGEPFFGQDRFDQFVWRLRQSGLTLRHKPIPPFTAKPLRWPDAAG
jgi:2-hydroxychromene-2-carboxylate isomerase